MTHDRIEHPGTLRAPSAAGWHGLRRLFAGAARAAQTPRPDVPFFAIGPVHGCFDHLQNMLHRIEQIDAGAPVILTGDMIDRGAHTADVLRFLAGLSDGPLICLRGKHEAMLIEMLDDPVVGGPRWLASGGQQTLASFGVTLTQDDGSLDHLLQVRDSLRRAIGPDLEDWIRALPAAWHSGNISVMHGGANPAVPMAQQQDRHLVWGHPDWPRRPRRDGQWIVNSIEKVPRPFMRAGQIALHTGADANGHLSAAHITANGVHFLTTGERTRMANST